MRSLSFALILALAACTPVLVQPPREVPVMQPAAAPAKLAQRQAIANFNFAVARIEPVVERLCQQRSPNRNCDFQIVVDNRPNQMANAF